MVKAENQKIKSLLDHIEIPKHSVPVYEGITVAPHIKKEFARLSIALSVPEEVLYNQAFELFLNLEAEWISQSNITQND
jgi:hypothetical protein